MVREKDSMRLNEIDKEEFVSKINGSFNDKIRTAFFAGYFASQDDAWGDPVLADKKFQKWLENPTQYDEEPNDE